MNSRSRLSFFARGFTATLVAFLILVLCGRAAPLIVRILESWS